MRLHALRIIDGKHTAIAYRCVSVPRSRLGGRRGFEGGGEGEDMSTRKTVRIRKIPDRHSASTIGVLYVEEVARELCISPSATYELIRRGKLKAIKMGRKLIRILRKDLEEYVENLAGHGGAG